MKGKLQKRILIALLVMSLLTPAGLFLPMFFDAGDAWGEWSAETIREFTGYVPKGMERYTDTWKAPAPDYTLNSSDPSPARQSGYYIISGIAGAIITMGVTLLISKIIVRHGKDHS